jgi:hypothetical protein
MVTPFHIGVPHAAPVGEPVAAGYTDNTCRLVAGQ